MSEMLLYADRHQQFPGRPKLCVPNHTDQHRCWPMTSEVTCRLMRPFPVDRLSLWRCYWRLSGIPRPRSVRLAAWCIDAG